MSNNKREVDSYAGTYAHDCGFEPVILHLFIFKEWTSTTKLYD